jgi:hypothetical protein
MQRSLGYGHYDTVKRHGQFGKSEDTSNNSERNYVISYFPMCLIAPM